MFGTPLFQGLTGEWQHELAVSLAAEQSAAELSSKPRMDSVL